MAFLPFVGSKLLIFSFPGTGVINIWGVIPPFFVKITRFLTFDIKKLPVSGRARAFLISIFRPGSRARITL